MFEKKNKRKIPADLRILGSLYVVSSLVTLWFSALAALFAGPEFNIEKYRYSILGGLVSFENTSPYAIYFLVSVIYYFVCGHGILTVRKYGWWLLICERILKLIGLINFFPHVPFRFAIQSLFFCVGVLVWAWWRRSFFWRELG